MRRYNAKVIITDTLEWTEIYILGILQSTWFQSYKQILSAHDAGVEKKRNKMSMRCLPAHPSEKLWL